MWMAVLLNSADFSRSCISSSCSNRKNMINNYFTILCKKMSISLNISSNFLGTSLDPRPPFGPNPPEIPTQKLSKQHPFFIKRETKLWNLALWIDPSKGGLQRMVLRSFWRQNQLHSTHSFQENIILVTQFGWCKILMAKIQSVLSHYFISWSNI